MEDKREYAKEENIQREETKITRKKESRMEGSGKRMKIGGKR